MPQFKFITDNDDFLRDVRNRYFGPEGTYLPIRTRKFDYVGVPIYEETQTAIIESGRECYYFNVYRKKDVLSDPDNAKLIAIVRIQDDQPTAHDILRQGSFIRPTRVPESKLISHVYDGSVDGSMRVFSVATSNEL